MGAVGVDQRVGLARQRRDLDRKFALEPFGAAGADIGDRVRIRFSGARPKRTWKIVVSTSTIDSATKVPPRVIIEAARFIENLGGVAGDADQELAVGAEVDRPFHHPQVLALRAIDVAEADAGRRQIGAVLFELGQFLVPQRARRPHLGLVGIGAANLPIPARQRQFEQRLTQRLELTVGRLVRGCDFGDQSAQIEVETAVEGALGRVAVHRGQYDSGDEQDHHHPCGRRQKKPSGERTGAHQGTTRTACPWAATRSMAAGFRTTSCPD